MKRPKTLRVLGAPVAKAVYEEMSYVKALDRLSPAIVERYPAAYIDAEIRHDDSCPVMLGDGICRCQADVYLRLGGPNGQLLAQCVNGVDEFFL